MRYFKTASGALHSIEENQTSLIEEDWAEITVQQLQAELAARRPVYQPDEITMRQARLALLKLGKLQDVEAAIQQLASPLKDAAVIAWEYSTVVRRDDSLVSVLQPMLGWSNEYMDQLFVTAARI